MDPVVTAAVMRELDRQTIEVIGIPDLVLMENAGRGAADFIQDQHEDLKMPSAIIFCGKGNNGGDGLVIARELGNRGWKVVVILLFPNDQLSVSARKQYDIFKHLTENDPDLEISITEIADSARIWELQPADVCVDAILGTGATGSDLPPLLFSAVEWMNASPSATYSIDIPTGLNSDTGHVANTCVDADVTIALGAMKQGFFVNEGPLHVGDLHVVDIGIPFRLMNQTRVGLNDAEDVRDFFPARNRIMHKYQAGHVVILAGSVGMHGAAVLAARAVLKTGAGIVTILTSPGAYPAVASLVTDALVYPVEWSSAAFENPVIAERIAKADVIVIGPGLGREPDTIQFIREFIAEIEVPVVLDADGLFAVSESLDFLSRVPAPLILTPHAGELCRLLGIDKDVLLADPVGVVREAAGKLDHILVLKGPHTLIALPDGYVIINPTGNSGLATAGSGDVLSGMVAGLIAQGSYPEDAAADAVYLHGLAADLAVSETTEYGLTASMLVEFIPIAIQELLSE